MSCLLDDSLVGGEVQLGYHVEQIDFLDFAVLA